MPSPDERINCPHCGQHLRIPSGRSLLGARCPRCRSALQRSDSGDGEPGTAMRAQRFGPYRLERKLGAGSMGRVYKAPGRDRPVAIKILSSAAAEDEELLARFEREAQLGMRCRHRNLVAVHARERHNEHDCLVMELVDGPSLEDLVDRHGALPWRRALGYIEQVGDALAYLHDGGILHRDVKPENVLVAAGDRPKLLDLGFAKELGAHDGDPPPLELTVSGTSLGSPAYMPPEQVLDAAKVGPGSDVYGLAASLYHLITGRLPFDGRSAVEVMEKVVRDELVPPREVDPSLPAALDKLVCWAMDKRIERRPKSMRAFLDLLQRVGEHPDDARAIRRARCENEAKGASITKIAWIGGLIVALAALVAALVFWLG